MTTLEKCPDCNSLLLRPGSCESCGWPKVRPKHAEPPKFKSSPSAEVARAFNEELARVNAYVAKYQAKYPGSTKREACMSLLRKKGLTGMLPPAVRREAEREARAEREAITAES